MREYEIHPNDPTLQNDKDNTCGYCGEPCENDFCNEDHFKAFFND